MPTVKVQNVFIAIGPHCWGKAASKPDAVKIMRRNWPRMIQKNAEYSVYSCHPDTEVTDMGGLSYPRTHPPVLVSKGKANSDIIPLSGS